MKLAFYYHITICKKGENLYTPGYLGVFIDSLAKEIDELYLLMHQANQWEIEEADYKLKNRNIYWINLGYKSPAWHRAIFHKKILKSKLKKIESCDALIVRSPTPLAPYFPKYLNKPKLIFMIVGDYLESVEQWKIKNIREWFELQYLRYNDFLFRKAMKITDIMVNSPVLFNKYKNIAKSIHQIKTTTLSLGDFYKRADTCQNNVVELVFTGRIDPLKGLFELVEAVASLRKDNLNIRLNITGWESDERKPIENELKAKLNQLGINEFVIFHGRKSIGPELNAMYRMGDIYVLPSYEEGFPRTIWEAMANGLPVITTDVGGIPSYLTHLENAYIIKPKISDLIVDGVKRIVSDKELRQKLIHNGYKIASENILENQTSKMLEIIKKLTHE